MKYINKLSIEINTEITFTNKYNMLHIAIGVKSYMFVIKKSMNPFLYHIYNICVVDTKLQKHRQLFKHRYVIPKNN